MANILSSLILLEVETGIWNMEINRNDLILGHLTHANIVVKASEELNKKVSPNPMVAF